LFNWLYARHCGGRFLLRIEDTDRERSTEANVQIILDGLSWLGVTWDDEPVQQFARADRHRECVEAMLAAGRAYRCFMTPEEADAAKEIARGEGHALRSPWRDREDWPSDAPFVVRFKAPMHGETVVEDMVRGRVSFPNKDLEDIVLLRSDGTPTYNVAVTVDDHDMGVTHIIRGEEHLSNAARQTLLYRAMGWDVPAFAHIPLIHGPDGAKLSKRHGAQAVGEFADMGYLPEGLRNYLARLGWGHGDDEVFTDDQAIEWFDVKDVVKAPARLDWPKLNHINNQHLRKADDARLAALTIEALERQGVTVLADMHDRLQRTVALVKEGCATTVELAAAAQFALTVRPFTLDDKTVKLLTDETRERLARLRQALAGVAAWEQPVLEGALKSFAESEGVGLGKFGPALRGILSGGHPAPDLASTLAALGAEEGLGRIDDALCAAQ
jgi:glutamyl-tRNA synthetase